MPAYRIATRPVHLGRNATATAEPEITRSMEWFEAYAQRHQSDGMEGRLVTMITFNESWNAWEMHPHGSELVLCTAGRITLHQEDAGGSRSAVMLTPGEYAINAPGVWHTADIDGEATALFITAGVGTQHRPRTGEAGVNAA